MKLKNIEKESIKYDIVELYYDKETTYFISACIDKGNIFLGAIRIHQSEKECLMHSLHVNIENTRQGVGASLIREAERQILLLGYDRAYLYVYRYSWMHDWYKRLDYEDTDEPAETGYVKMVKYLFLRK